MNRHTVVWLQDAQDELAQIWLDSDDREAVTQATSTIDSVLAVDPHSQGQPLAEGLCKLRIAPLEVAFIVRGEDRLVEVASVKNVQSSSGSS